MTAEAKANICYFYVKVTTNKPEMFSFKGFSLAD